MSRASIVRIPSKLSLQQLDAQLLMWDMRRGLRFEPAPTRRLVIQFQFPEAPSGIVTGG